MKYAFPYIAARGVVISLARLLLSAAIAVAVTLTPAAAQDIARKDKVIFELAKPIEEPNNFNWYFRGTRREHGAHQVMWEPLFLLDYATGALEPWLATSITPNTSQDVWTLTLRKDVKWSDGKPFSADDVVFTVDMVLKNDLPALEAVTLRAQVESVAKVDALKVTFKLRKPNPRFALENFGATLFSSLLIMPKHVWEKEKDPTKFTFSKPIGTGPYKLKEATNKMVTWIRDANWWGAKTGFKKLPEPLQLEWQVVDNETASKALLEKNELDAAREYTLENLNDVKSKNAKIIGWDASSPLAWNDPCARQLEINTQREPWKDPRLRRALSLLVDRARLARVIYGETVQPSRTMFAEYGAMKPFIDAATMSAGYELAPIANPAAARVLLEAAGYQKNDKGVYMKDSEALRVTILVNADLPKDIDAANELGTQLKEAGIEAKVESIPNDDYWGNAVPNGEYEMVYSWLSCGSLSEPYTSMSRYRADKAVPLGSRSPAFNNTGRWDSQAAKDYSAVVSAMASLQAGDAAVPSLVTKAYQFLNVEMPFIPLVQSPKIIPFNTTFWTGWPVKGGPGVPMHSWAATHRLIHGLKKAN